MRISNKAWVLLSTLIIISLAFFYYFFVYVPRNEEKLVNNNMRILEKIKGNIHNLLENERKIIRNEKGQNITNIIFGADNLVFKLETSENDASNPTETGKEGSLDDATSNKEYPVESVVNKSYAEILQNPLIERRDVFDFVSITQFRKEEGTLSMLYINDPKGQIITLDSIESNYTSNSLFEIDFGYNKYKAFNISYLNNEENNIFLTGYISKDIYEDKKREVSIYLISFILILTVLLIHALPFIKLWVMSHSERLSLKDIFFTGVSISLLPTVLILVILFFTYHFGNIGKQTKSNLEHIHFKIENNFKEELKNVTNLLSEIKQNINKEISTIDSSNFTNKIRKLSFFEHSSEIDSVSKKIKYYTAFRNFKSESLPPQIDEQSKYKYFNSIFWCDPKGKIRIYLSNEKNASLLYDLSHRNYVMDIPNGNTFNYNGQNISFESIRSVSDGNYEMGLGMESGIDSLPVLATSLSLVSIMNPILEEGYGFCFFDETGNTLFHSDKNRNLNENFLEETNNNFNYNIESNSPSHEKVNYMGKEHYMYMNKVDGLDHIYLATFLDSEFIDTSNSLAISSTIVFQLIFLAVLLLLSVALFSTTGNYTLIKQKRFLFFWLRPYTDENTKAKEMYGNLILFNFFGILFLILNWALYENSIGLLIFSVISTCSVLITYNFWKITSYLFQVRNYISNSPDMRNKIFKLFILTSIIFIIVVKMKWYSESVIYIYIDLLILLIFILTIYNFIPFGNTRISLKRFSDNLFKSKLLVNIYSIYKLYVLSLLILITILPPIIFYSIAFKMESSLAFINKTKNIDFNIKSWKDEKRSQFVSEKEGRIVSNIENLDVFINQMKMDDLIFLFFNNPESSISEFADSNLKDTTVYEYPINHIVPYWYSGLRFPFNRYGELTNALIASDSSFIELYKEKGSDQFILKNNLFDLGIEHYDSILYSSFAKNTSLFFLFIVTLIFIYFILNFTINKIYGLDFRVYAKTMIFETKLNEFMNQLISIYTELDERQKLPIQEVINQGTDQKNVSLPGLNAYNNILITGVNASHISAVYHSLKSKFSDRFFSMDMLLITDFCEKITEPRYKNHYLLFPEVNYQIDLKLLFNVSEEKLLPLKEAIYDKPDLNSNSKSPQLIVLIEHFEFSYENIELNKIKLGIIRRLIANSTIRVIICSEMSLIKIHEYYEDQLKRFKIDLKKDGSDYLEKQRMIDDIANDYRMWLHLFGSFYNITIPLESTGSFFDESRNEFPFLKSELKHGTYLRKINLRFQMDLENSGQTNRLTFNEINDEDLILNIQEIAYPYYFSVWNSLSKQEQYIVYDIAMDGFVNPNNVNGILELLHKGILVYDDSLRLMNASFTNFVLTKVDNDISLKNELASKENGNWSVTSSVFLMVILGLIIFVSFGKIHILDDMNALLGSIAAVFTLLLRLSGIFSFSKD